MLDALKTGNINKIAKYQDISIVDVDTFIKKESDNLNIADRIEKLKEHREKNKEKTIKDIRVNVIEKLSILDVDMKKANKYLDIILEQDNNDIRVEEVAKEILKKLLIDEEKSVQIIRKAKSKINNNDVRNIVKQGKVKKLDSYNSLRNSDVIKSYNDFGKVVV